MAHPALVHAAGRAHRARRGVPRRRGRRAASTAPGPRSRVAIRAPGDGRDRAHRVGGRRHHQAAREAGQRPRQARRSPRRGAGHRARRSCTRSPVRAPLGRRPGDANAGSPSSASSTVGDLAALPEDTLVRALGNAHGPPPPRAGVEPRRPAGRADQDVKSIGHEETFPTDLHDHAALEHAARPAGRRRGVAAARRARRRPGPCSSRCASATSAPSPAPARWRSRPTWPPTSAGWPASCSGRWTSAAACACWASRRSSSCAGTPRQLVRHREPAGRRARSRLRSGTDAAATRARCSPTRRGADEAGAPAADPAGERRQAALERSVDAVRARFGPGAVGQDGRIACQGKVPGLLRVEASGGVRDNG